MSNTLPSPGSATASLTRELSSKQTMVATGPQSELRKPNAEIEMAAR